MVSDPALASTSMPIAVLLLIVVPNSVKALVPPMVIAPLPVSQIPPMAAVLASAAAKCRKRRRKGRYRRSAAPCRPSSTRRSNSCPWPCCSRCTSRTRRWSGRKRSPQQRQRQRLPGRYGESRSWSRWAWSYERNRCEETRTGKRRERRWSSSVNSRICSPADKLLQKILFFSTRQLGDPRHPALVEFR